MNKIFLCLSIFLTISCVSQDQSRDIAASSGIIVDKTGYKFDTADTSCAGFPKLKVQTTPGTCLGMVFGDFNTQGSDGKTLFKMPRTITKIPASNDFLVADMGGWADKIGALFWIHQEAGKYKLLRVLKSLDYPHGLTYNDNDGFFYIGERNAIFRFHFKEGQVTDKQFVVQNLPDTAKHMHPLTQFVFDPKTGDLFMNSGAPTDHCYQKTGIYSDRCPEEITQKMATIQKITRAQLDQLPKEGLGFGDVQVVARGLRNSMAMAIHPAGRFLVQGENSRDFPELEEPYEEMNLIRLDSQSVKHYGWPYCYNNHGESPEWEDILIDDGDKKYTLPPANGLKSEHGPNPFYCGRHAIQGRKEYQRPLTLIPPHAAPLGALYYEGPMKQMFMNLFKDSTTPADKMDGVLLMSWHGYRTTGQRMVVYPVNKEGLPIPSKQGRRFYNFNLPNGCPKPAPFNPRGGLRNHFVDYREVISGWGPIEGQRPKGAPVGFTVANDGSIWIVDDKNKSIVRLAATTDPAVNYQQTGCDQTPGQNKDYNVPLLVWRNALKESDSSLKLRDDFNLIAKGLKSEKFACAKCHDNLINADLNPSFKDKPDEFATMDYFVRMDWVTGGKPMQSKMFTSVSHLPGTVPMPAEPGESLLDSTEGKDLIQAMERWIQRLPSAEQISKRSEQTTVSQDKLNIRLTPGTEFGPCGQFQKDDTIYVDPRAESKKVVGNFKWSKVYLVPGHSRLVPGACAYPLDGTFWIAREPK